MPKFVNNITLVTQSFNSASLLPNENALYASGSSLYFYNDVGVTYNLTQNTIVREYIATGSHTWFTPTGIRELLIVCVGAGGGGGSGLFATTNRTGGGGGNGGTIAMRIVPSSLLTQSSYTIIVGAGGAGRQVPGAGAGTAGGSSSFSPFVVARGGTAGQGGGSATITGAPAATPITNNTPNYGPYSIEGAGQGARAINFGSAGGSGLTDSIEPASAAGAPGRPRPGAPAGGNGGGGQAAGGRGGGVQGDVGGPRGRNLREPRDHVPRRELRRDQEGVPRPRHGCSVLYVPRRPLRRQRPLSERLLLVLLVLHAGRALRRPLWAVPGPLLGVGL